MRIEEVGDEETEVVLYERRGATAARDHEPAAYRNAQNAQMTYALDAALHARRRTTTRSRSSCSPAPASTSPPATTSARPGRDIHQSFPRVATTWWEHEDKAGAENLFVREQELYLGMCRRWRELPKPTIAMVQGACIAGGLMLAWVCDLIVAADDAFFADPVVKMGIPGVEYFAHPFVISPRIAKEFLFLGERIDARAGARDRAWSTASCRATRSTTRRWRSRARIGADAALRLALAKKAVNQAEDRMGLRDTMDADLRAASPRARAQRADLARITWPAKTPKSMAKRPASERDGPDVHASASDAFRDEARAWLAGQRAGGAAAVGRHGRGLRARTSQWERRLFEAALGGRLVAARVRRPRAPA